MSTSECIFACMLLTWGWGTLQTRDTSLRGRFCLQAIRDMSIGFAHPQGGDALAMGWLRRADRKSVV